MAKTKPKHRPGIHLFREYDSPASRDRKSYYYWHTRAKNGRVTSSGETYKTKQGALDGAASAAKTFGASGRFKYYDHSQPNTPLKPYL